DLVGRPRPHPCRPPHHHRRRHDAQHAPESADLDRFAPAREARCPHAALRQPAAGRHRGDRRLSGDAAMTDRAAEEKQLAKVWAHPTGWRYFSDVNNSVIGIWYITAAFAF